MDVYFKYAVFFVALVVGVPVSVLLALSLTVSGLIEARKRRAGLVLAIVGTVLATIMFAGLLYVAVLFATRDAVWKDSPSPHPGQQFNSFPLSPKATTLWSCGVVELELTPFR